MRRWFSNGLFLLALWCCVFWIGEARGEAPKPSSAVSLDMQPGRAYGAGKRVHIPKGSASFVVPTGWHAQLPEDSDAIIAVSESGAGFVMVFMILNVSEEELTALLAESQPITHDLVFEPSGPVVKKGNRVTATYEAGSLSGRTMAVLGPAQQGVLFFLGRPRTESSEADRVLDDLAESIVFIDSK